MVVRKEGRREKEEGQCQEFKGRLWGNELVLVRWRWSEGHSARRARVTCSAAQDLLHQAHQNHRSYIEEWTPADVVRPLSLRFSLAFSYTKPHWGLAIYVIYITKCIEHHRRRVVCGLRGHGKKTPPSLNHTARGTTWSNRVSFCSNGHPSKV